jgi:ABC-type dipeptide/oligopeptide/nickel transport system permease subunit
MEACRAIGVPARRQFLRHLLPNLVGPMVVYATLAVPAAILSESFLSFLGIGVREPVPSWGSLASAGLSEVNLVSSRWWLLAAPCAMIAATLVSLNFIGDSLRARYDPTASRARW